MIVYTVFDCSDGIELMFTSKKNAISCAKNLSSGTIVERIDIGKPNKQRICDCYNHDGYSVSSEKIFETP